MGAEHVQAGYRGSGLVRGPTVADIASSTKQTFVPGLQMPNLIRRYPGKLNQRAQQGEMGDDNQGQEYRPIDVPSISKKLG